MLQGTNTNQIIGLVAGHGDFPIEFIKAAKAKGLKVFAVAHLDETKREVEELADKCTWIRIGQLGKMIKLLAGSGVKQVAFIGGIRRDGLFKRLRPDFKGFQLLARLRSSKDDLLLRAVAGELEAVGVEVIAPSDILSESIIKCGVLTKRGLTEQELIHAKIGWEAAHVIGKLDIGQTVVVNGGIVVAVEAGEGTDGTIERGGKLSGPGAVVVKRCKPQQDRRLDLPAVGEGTIRKMIEVKASALVLDAGKALLLAPDEIVRLADSNGITVVAYDGEIR